MPRKPEKDVVRHLTSEELNKEIKKRKIDAVILKKLLFIKMTNFVENYNLQIER